MSKGTHKDEAGMFALAYADTIRRMLAEHAAEIAARPRGVRPDLAQVPDLALAAAAGAAIVIQHGDPAGAAIRRELAEIAGGMKDAQVWFLEEWEASLYLVGRPEARTVFDERCPAAAAHCAGPPLGNVVRGKLLFFAVAGGRTRTMHLDIAFQAPTATAAS